VDIDVDFTAKFSPPFASPLAKPNDENTMCGGGYAKVTICIIAKDINIGSEIEQLVYIDSMGTAGPFPALNERAFEPRLPIRLIPGHKYQFAVQLYASACGYDEPSSRPGQPSTRGDAEAEGSVTVFAMMLIPTNGPKVEATVLDVYPVTYDTYDHYEKALLRFRKKQYFPTVARIHCFFGGQYAAEDSSLYISLRGGGKIDFIKPDVVAAGGFTEHRISDFEIKLTPPPPVPGGMGGWTLEPLIRIDAEAHPNKAKLDGVSPDHILAPVQRLWTRIDMRTPEQPHLVVPQNRIMNICTIARWFVLAPADEAIKLCKTSPCQLAKPMPVLYSQPNTSRSAIEDKENSVSLVPNWQVQTVDWQTLAKGSIAAYNKPIVALNLEALSDLYVAKLPEELEKSKTFKSLNIKPVQLPKIVLPQRISGKKLVMGKPKKGIYLKRLGMGYYPGDPASKQMLLNQLDALVSQWAESVQLRVEDRPLLVVYQDENGRCVTGKELLEGLDAGDVLDAMVDVYRKAQAAQQLLIHFHHLDLYSEPQSLAVKGIAANGSYFKCEEEDTGDFRTVFDFVPRPADIIIPLVPYMPDCKIGSLNLQDQE
jgi:hypothetical protein